jgi:hypothetical protein
MKYRTIRRNNYPIEVPSLDAHYNCVYSLDSKRIYYGCPKNCSVCVQWKKKGEIWKAFHFYPIHCHFCCATGISDDFYLENIFIMCKECNEKLNKRRKDFRQFHL